VSLKATVQNKLSCAGLSSRSSFWCAERAGNRSLSPFQSQFMAP